MADIVNTRVKNKSIDFSDLTVSKWQTTVLLKGEILSIFVPANSDVSNYTNLDSCAEARCIIKIGDGQTTLQNLPEAGGTEPEAIPVSVIQAMFN